MPPPVSVTLGPLTRVVLENAVWRGSSEFPAEQEWADDAERIFAFLEAQGVFTEFLPRLTARGWEGAFAEARVGYFFKRNGFQIPNWESFATRCAGDLKIQWRESEPIFVEVKGPGWEGELTEEERNAGRKRLPKYINAEARLLDTIGPLCKAINKALPKFAPERINIVAIADDLFMSPLELPREIVDPRILRHLAEPACVCVGGVFFLYPVKVVDRPLEYRHLFIPNPTASHPLPAAVLQGLVARK